MEEADLLCHSLFRWLENRKECADKLLELAQKLEKVHRDGKIAKGFGAAVSVASITGAVVAGVVTEGLAIPLLVATATGSTVVATKVSAIPTLVEAGISWRTFKKVNKLIKEDEEVETSIQKHLRDLKDRCGGTQLRDHADELECEVTTQLMCALARRNKTHVPLDFLRGFNKATFFRHLTSGGLDPAEASRFICRALNLDSSPEITSSLKVSAKEMMKNIGQIGIKAAVQAGSRVRGATGLGLSLNDLIVKCKEIVKRKRVTEASKFLRDSAREILERQKKLKEQLDAMHEIIQKLFRMRNLIKDLGGYSLSMNENGQNVMAYIMGTCTDSTVVSWLWELTHQIEFVNLLRFVLENLGSIPEDLRRPDGRHIDIVFVAHGSIVDQFMPAGGLVPTPNIIDTILYSPWNCSIDSCAAFGIAHGNIQVTDRVFYNSKPEANNTVYYEPNPLPDHWNSMRESLHNIPGILLSPVTPEERAWAFFHQFWMDRSMEIENRIIIPYLVPQNMVNALRVIPLYMFIFVTSFILMAQGKTATVHLVACLNRHVGSTPMPEEWRRQYAYTSDGTVMTVNMVTEMNSMLFTALRSLFDSQEP